MAASDGYVGLFMQELPPDWWLPPGYSLTSSSPVVPLSVSDPSGRPRFIYPIAGYRPLPERERSLWRTITSDLGPPPSRGFSLETRQWLGMERPDLLGLVDRAFYGPLELGAYVLDLASYGIRASIVSGIEGAGRAGWISDTAGWRKELLGFLEFLGIELGRAPAATIGRGVEVAQAAKLSAAQVQELREAAKDTLGRVEAAANAIAVRARAAAGAFSPPIVRMEAVSGLPYGRSFEVIDIVEADPGLGTSGPRTLTSWFDRIRAGREFDRQQAMRYRFNQIYVVKENGGGYWVLDSYRPFDPVLGAGPVSRKYTQLADIRAESAIAMLREAHKKYKPGARIANVWSRPLTLRDSRLAGQLWLEVPVQTKPIPAAILQSAAGLSIKIRDINGKIY